MKRCFSLLAVAAILSGCSPSAGRPDGTYDPGRGSKAVGTDTPVERPVQKIEMH